jgi:hypothetical protein
MDWTKKLHVAIQGNKDSINGGIRMSLEIMGYGMTIIR